MNDTMNYELEDVITYQAWGGAFRTGTVIGKYADIKNGRPGFDMIDAAGETWWGYDDQIVRVGD